MNDPRWRRLSRWVRERERAMRLHRTGAWYGEIDRQRAEVFKAVLLVMEAETRRYRRERAKMRPPAPETT